MQGQTPIVGSVQGVIIMFLEQFSGNHLYYANILGYAMQRGDAVSVFTFIIIRRPLNRLASGSRFSVPCFQISPSRALARFYNARWNGQEYPMPRFKNRPGDLSYAYPSVP